MKKITLLLLAITLFFTGVNAQDVLTTEEMNSVYIKSAPCVLHKARNGGSLTSSIGARRRGKSPSSMSRIFAIGAKIRRNYELLSSFALAGRLSSLGPRL